MTPEEKEERRSLIKVGLRAYPAKVAAAKAARVARQVADSEASMAADTAESAEIDAKQAWQYVAAGIEEIDLECTGEDDHDSPHCDKCARIRRRIRDLVKAMYA